MIQAQESLNNFFINAVVQQESWTKVDAIEKPVVQVCFPSLFDYFKASEFGYSSRSKFLAGKLQNSTKPTWKGIKGNSNFSRILKEIYIDDFSKVNINQQAKHTFILNKGFCQEIKSINEYLRIISTDKKIRAYIIHNSTDTKVISDTNQVEIGLISNTTSEFKVYDVHYEIHDNTIYEGIKCFDYRKQKETYGECNYLAFKQYIYSVYGCYPPWIDEKKEKLCELSIETKEIDSDLFDKVWNEILKVSDRRKIDVMDQCMPPCYQVQAKFEEKMYETFIRDIAKLLIFDEAKTVPIFKTVYSKTIFTLAVELGSGLGLWLGK
jgi:hypothetical protein